MSRKEQGVNPLEEAGYEKNSIFEDISTFDADNVQIVYNSSNDIVSVGVVEGEVVTNRLSVDIDDPIEDIATGNPSSIFLLIDGELRALSTRGEVSDPWAQGVTQVAVPNEKKIVYFVDESGDIHGLEAQNRLPKFQKFSFENTVGDKIEPNLVARRSGFITFGGSILRSYNQRGVLQWQTEFNADIIDVAQPQGDCIVGLSNDSIYWIGNNGERTMDIGGSLDCISSIGHRMVIGSTDGSLTAFGDNGVAPKISENKTSNVVQTSDDTLVGLVNDSTLELFKQKSPNVQVNVISEHKKEGGKLTGYFENPYPIGLHLEIEVGTDNSNEADTNSIFLSPNQGESEEMQLSNVNQGDEFKVVVKSRDADIIAYEGVVTAKLPESINQRGEDVPEREKGQIQDVTEIAEQSEEAVLEKKLEDRDIQKDSENTKKDTDSGPIETRNNEDDTGVSLSLELVNISSDLLKWKIKIQNNTEEIISNPTVEETHPVKFDIDGPTNTDIVTAGDSFVTNGSMSYRPGTVEVEASWEDIDGEDHKRIVESETPVGFFEVSAERITNDELNQVEFTLRNYLDFDIQDTVEIITVGKSQDDLVGQHKITLQPGINTINKYIPSNKTKSSGSIDSYQVKLQYLGISDTCDVTPISGDPPLGDPNQIFERGIHALINNDGKIEIQNINHSLPPQSGTDVIQESLLRKNKSETWLPSEYLWSENEDDWKITNKIIPSIQQDETIKIYRYWQTVGNKKPHKLDLPGYRLGSESVEISSQERKVSRPQVRMLCAFLPIGPNQGWTLLTYIRNHTMFPLQLNEFQMEGIPINTIPKEFTIDKEDQRFFYVDIPKSVDPSSFNGLAQAKLSSISGRIACQAVVITRNNPVLDESKIWFDINTRCVENETNKSLVLTLENTLSKRIENLSIKPHGRASAGVEVSACSPRESVSLRRHVNDNLSEKRTLEDGLVYEITAVQDKKETSNYVRIESSDETDQDFEARVLPSEQNIDPQRMIESWPEQFATDWRYDPSVLVSHSRVGSKLDNTFQQGVPKKPDNLDSGRRDTSQKRDSE